ncbi:MAG: hypothetical protein OXU26_16660 [Acidobacteriota bacterium]|nr:hypothetical protein [Acidobacteriota bacterium]MDE2965542.1 hypothetical protein [Acidobacteriota bacterium]
MNEADTYRKYVVPKLQAAGWGDRPPVINEQRTFTDGWVAFVGGAARRGKQKRADYLLRYSPDFPIAIVEAKARYKRQAEGLQQALDYAAAGVLNHTTSGSSRHREEYADFAA